MTPRLKCFLTSTALAVLFQFAAAGTAFAHHPEISARVVCDGGYKISFTAVAWSEPVELATVLARSNPEVVVAFNGNVVRTGAFNLANNFQFSGLVPLDGYPLGTNVVVSVTAVAAWESGEGGGQVQSVTVSIPTEPCGTTSGGTGRFTGGGNQVEVGGVAKVTRGLTIHCDLLLSNNLEINWNGGNQFHLTEHLTTLQCSDDPRIDQNPPKAPLDTLVGEGVGRFNGQAGYTIRFTLVDAGEPGRNDQMWFTIKNAAGQVVFEVSEGSYLTGGNLQAHYDQPHKK